MIGFALINYLCVIFSVLSLHLHLLYNFCLDPQVFLLLLFLGTGGLEVRECTYLGKLVFLLVRGRKKRKRERKREIKLSYLLEVCT